jgi:hypothetical protein
MKKKNEKKQAMIQNLEIFMKQLEDINMRMEQEVENQEKHIIQMKN